MNQIARRIRQFREDRKWSLEQLAERCGCARQSVFCWESGRSTPSRRHISALKRLGLDLSEFESHLRERRFAAARMKGATNPKNPRGCLPATELKMRFGRRLRAWRESAGMSALALADELDVTSGAVSRWENGVGSPCLAILGALAACGADINFMLAGIDATKRAA